MPIDFGANVARVHVTKLNCIFMPNNAEPTWATKGQAWSLLQAIYAAQRGLETLEIMVDSPDHICISEADCIKYYNLLEEFNKA